MKCPFKTVIHPFLSLQWAERRLEGGATEQWGDKWEEDFAYGKGNKKVRDQNMYRLAILQILPEEWHRF